MVPCGRASLLLTLTSLSLPRQTHAGGETDTLNTPHTANLHVWLPSVAEILRYSNLHLLVLRVKEEKLLPRGKLNVSELTFTAVLAKGDVRLNE